LPGQRGYPGGARQATAPAAGARNYTPGAAVNHGPKTPVQNLGGHPYPIRKDLPPPVGLNPPAAAYTGISPGAFKSYGSGGRGYGGGYIGAPAFFPYLGYGSNFYSAPEPPLYDPNAEANAAVQDAMAQQIQQLSADLEAVKQQQPRPAAPAAAPSQPPPPAIPITLVLRSGQQLSVQSYAVMNGTLWDLSKQPARKYPISGIDIPASEKATEANGGEFPRLP